MGLFLPASGRHLPERLRPWLTSAVGREERWRYARAPAGNLDGVVEGLNRQCCTQSFLLLWV
ncbi:MAG: hypothetical protein ACXWWE_07395 [Nitrospira sp.]